MLTDEPHMPYDRPPLSKEGLSRDHPDEPVPLLTREQASELAVDVLLGHRAVRLDPARREVTVEREGAVKAVGYDALVIATGAAARHLPGAETLRGVHVLRSLDDARALRAEMTSGRRVVVVGAGFIGAEFASAAHSRGMDVRVIETQTVPLAHLLGVDVGAELASVHGAHGVQLVTGVGVSGLRSYGGSVTSVELDDGSELVADLVVVGIGAQPCTGWLEGSGLPVADGIDCDEDLGVVGFPGIYAVGDVARWPHPSYDEPIRVEHWTNAADHAQIVAAHVVGDTRPAATPPYVWSDQYGHRIQIVGRPSEGSAHVVRGSMAARDLVAIYGGSDGAVVGAVVVDDPRLFIKVRKAVTASLPVKDVQSALLAPA
jgi:NADPH-dependent 2,4-dienoyl-CoA reductase/sulfur reductase-like enzyme